MPVANCVINQPLTFGVCPNVFGEMNIYSGFGGTGVNPSGCLYIIDVLNTGSMIGGDDPKQRIGLNASLSNSIYGSNNKVQVRSIQFLMIIKA